MILLLFVGFVGLIVAMGLVRGFVLSYLWAWFIVPLGAPQIGIAHAIGLSLLVGMFTSNLKRDDEKVEGADALAKIGSILAKVFGQALFVLGLGYMLSWIVAA